MLEDLKMTRGDGVDGYKVDPAPIPAPAPAQTIASGRSARIAISDGGACCFVVRRAWPGRAVLYGVVCGASVQCRPSGCDGFAQEYVWRLG